MNIFKCLSVPEQEQQEGCHKGKWFVFIDDTQPYTGDGLHFLHNNSKRLCKLKDNDKKNARIMFDTECEAFVKSFNYYILHGKELEYPWWDEMEAVESREQLAYAGDSQVMEFEK